MAPIFAGLRNHISHNPNEQPDIERAKLLEVVKAREMVDQGPIS